MRKIKLFLTLLMLMCIGVTQMWGEVVSGTAYTTTSGSFPTGWTKLSSNEQSKYLGLQANTNYIQTENFCQNGFTSIVVSARKVGGPSDAQKEITIEWVPEVGSAVVLGTVSPSGTSLENLTLSSFTNTPSANTSGSIKLSCKGASDNKGSGVGAVTITYTAGTCGSTPTEQYSVSWEVNGSAYTEGNPTTSVSSGSKVTALPTPPAKNLCDGSKEFVGWTNAAIDGSTDTKPVILFVDAADAPAVTADITYKAVFATIESSSSQVEGYAKYSGVLTEGDYVFIYNTYVMGNTIASNRLTNGTFPTITDDFISDPAAALVWTIGIDDEKYTLYNAAAGKYLAKTSSNNQASLVATVSDNGARYSCSSNANSTTYDFVNAGNSRYLRNNGGNGWAMYSSSTGGALTLYKKSLYNVNISDTSAYVTTCSTPTCEKLGTPVVSVSEANLTYNSAKLTWATIANAAKYVVKFNGTDHETTELFYNATDLDAATNYSYQVKAVAAANQDAYCDGDFSASAQLTTKAAPAVAVDPSSWDFEAVATDAAVSKVFSVSGTNLLAGDLTITVPSGYSVSPESITMDAAGNLDATEVTVSKNTTTVGTYEGNMTISGCGLASAVEVALSMTVAEKYTVKFNTGEGNPAQADITESAPGAGITLPAGPTPKCSADGWAFAGWAAAAVGEETTTAPTLLSGTYHPEANNETLYAVYSRSEDSGNPNVFAKVTDAAILNNGDNFILVSTGSYTASQVQYNFTKAMKGKNGTNTNFADTDVTISSDEVVLDANSEAVVYTLKKVDSKWKIYAGENYLKSGNKSLDNTTEDEATEFSISISEGNATISDGTYSLLYNPNSGNGRFACYNSAQKPVMIFKNSASTIYYLSAPDCCEKHTITIATGIEHGSVEADLNEACQNTIVTLTPTAEGSYHFEAWSVKDANDNPITVTDNKFTMPATAVTVSATFVHDACQNLAQPALDGEIAKTYHSATIVWGEVEHASSYLVSVIKNGAEEPIFSGSITELSKALSDLEAETQYNYSIMAVGDGVDYCAEGNTALEGNFTTAALPDVKLTLMVGGAEDTDLSGNHTILTPFNLPNTAAVAGCPKVFVGWSADADRTTAPEYAPGAEFTFADETPATLYAVFAKEGAAQAITYPIDFEDNADTYTDWTLTNITAKQTDSNVSAHGDNYFGANANNTTSASLVTKEKIATPSSITFYVTRKTTNSSESTWAVEVSSDGTSWTQVGDAQDAKSMARGTWVEVTRDLSEHTNVYVRVSYNGGTSTAIRCIDDLVLSAVGSTTYSEYGTECEACKTVTLAKSGEDQEKGNTFALKVGDDIVESVQTCEAANVTIEPTVATGYEVSFAISELTGASLSENTISLAAATYGTLTVTATYSQINHKVVLAQTPEIGATLSGATEEAHYGATINLSATNIPEGYEFTGWTPAELFADAEAASAANTSFTMPNNDVTVTANFAKKYTVTFNVGSNPITEESVGAGVTLPEGPAPSAACVTAGWAFAGWAESAIADETTDAQTLLNGEYHPTKDITLYAVYSRTESGDPVTSYVQVTELDQVNAGGEFIITNGTKYLPSTTTSSSVAQADMVAITDGVVTGTVVDAMKWNISVADEDGYVTVKNAAAKYLYATNSNSGLRVGDTEDTWKFEEYTVSEILGFAMQEKTNSRWCAVYTAGSDWRPYGEKAHTNYKTNDGRLDLYKAVSAPTSTTYYWSAPECCVPHNVAIADNIEHGTVVANPTSACAGATITVTLTAENGYELTAWTVDEEAQELTATTFTMPNKDVVVSATFSEIVTPPAEATLKLMENGSEVTFEGNHKVGDVVTLPSALSDAEHACEGKILKGWSAVEIATPVAAKPSENFYELGAEYTIATEEDDVLYAVFAEEVPGVTSTTNITYSGSTTNLAVNTNEAAKFELDAAEWSVVGAKGGNSNNVGLNQAGDIRLYYHANGSNTLTITAPQTITSVGLTFTSNDYSNAYVEVGGETVALSDGVYPINATSFVIGNANTSNVQVRIKKIEVNFTGAGSVANYATSCVEPLANPTFSPAEQEEPFTTAQTITLSAEEGTIYYTLNGATPTSASTQYEAEAPIVLNDCGTTTIKAIAISANNHSEVVSATYTINIPLPTISEANPYTPAQAIEVFDGNCYNNEMVYVKGVVKTSSGLNTTYGNYDNIVVVAAETTAPEFTFFHMYKGAEKVQFDANDPAIAAGDTIVAYGELTKYGQIYEFKDGCYLIDRKAYNVPKQSIVNDIEHPYTLDDAINFLENAATYDLSGEVYVKGVATTAPNNNNTFTAHDPEAENVFQFYNTNLNELTVGVNDTIIVKGLIKKVNANYRMEAGVVQQVTAYVAPVVPEFTVNPTAVAFGNVEQNAQVDAIELNVELTAIASATVTLADENGVFSIDKTALTETGVVTVSVVSTATVGNYAATITLYDVAEAAEDVVVNVTMNVTEVETRNIANGSAFTAISGDLTPADIKYAAFKGDGTTTPAITKDSDIRLYKPDANNDKTTGGYLKLTALMGCTIDQVEITFNGQATASYAVNDAAFSTDAYITNQTLLLTPTGLDATSVSIVNLKNGSIDISAIKVYYNGSPLAVHHYILGGTYETTFEQYGEFSYEGLTVTAAYNEQETITEAITGFTVEADLMTAGAKKAEVYLGETKIAEYDITVNESPKQNPALAYAPSVQIVPAAEVGDWTAPEFSNTLNVAPISYSSNKPAVATVDENGVIALAGGYGTAVITASFAGDDDHIASEATYTVTVQEPIENLTGPWMVAVQSDIKVGMRVIIAGTHDNATKTMGGQNNENNRLAIAATLSNGVLTPATGTKVFELVDAGDGKYAFKGLNGKYLSAAGTGTANVLNEAADYEAANAQWSISFANNGSANIVASSNNRNAMQYNSGSSLFACYASTTSQKPVYLYVNKTVVTEDIDASTLPEGSIVVVNDDVEMTIDQEVSLGDIYVKDGQTLTIEASEDATFGNLDLENGAVWDLNITTPGATVTVNDLILRSNSADRDAQEGKSSQAPGVLPAINGILALEIDLRPELAADATLSTEQSEQWYCISAPFDVDINSGFEWVYPDGHRTPMVHNVDFQIFEYDGERRASGISGWKRIGGTMKAGVAHFIGFDNARTNQKVIRLTAKTNTITPVTEIALGSYPGATDYQNWNGVANPTLQYIGIDKDIVAFDYGIQDYNTYAATSYNYFVGSPFFIQQDGGSIVVDHNDRGGAIHAPKYEEEKLEYCVRINAAGAKSFESQMYVRASETASNSYEEGHDLASQCSTTPKYGARIWTENYNLRLGIEEAPLTNGNATYVLGIATPSAGEYTISVAAPKENADLYLTYNGSIIWNLSDGAYTVDLAKGVTSGYGLVLQAKAPHVATGVDNAEANEAGVQKVIINDHVYILRAEQMYDVTGKAVK